MKNSKIALIILIILSIITSCSPYNMEKEKEDAISNTVPTNTENTIEQLEPVDIEITEEISNKREDELIDLELKGYTIPIEQNAELDIQTAELFFSTYLEELKNENVIEDLRISDYKINSIVLQKKLKMNRSFLLIMM